MRYPTVGDDIRRLLLIAVSALVAVGVTVALVANSAPDHNGLTIEIQISELPDGSAHANRLYGRVLTLAGDEFEGFLRWDQNEGSWADVLDASKVLERARVGSDDLSFAFDPSISTIAGIRFGHILSIEVLDDDAAFLVLKSGEVVELGAYATDLGSNLRALVVEDAAGVESRFQWRDLDIIEFMPAPEGQRPSGRRLHGTLMTRSGLEFTGYVAWDVEEIYTTDLLDGEEDGRQRGIPFGSIVANERYTSGDAYVRLESGEEILLRDSQDVDDSNRGISVSDASMGQVLVDWGDFESVRFHPAEAPAGYGQFDGGVPIHGTVVTTSGDEMAGDIRWDADEAYTWEMLNGEYGGIEFQIEFSRIASITRRSLDGVTVELKDGRTFDLSGTNDVSAGNKGVFITDANGNERLVEWQDFDSVRFSGR